MWISHSVRTGVHLPCPRESLWVLERLLVPFPKWKVHVPPGHEIMWSQPSLPGCVQWFKAFDFCTGERYRDKLLATDNVSSRLQKARAVQLWVGLVIQERLAKSRLEDGNRTTLRKTETWRRTQETSPASLPWFFNPPLRTGHPLLISRESEGIFLKCKSNHLKFLL